MSQSLLIRWDPVEQPSAADPVEQNSWCALQILVNNRFVTQLWDKSLSTQRSTLYVPAFPIAEWFAQNWWSLFHEVQRSERLATASSLTGQADWIRRHCLRTADSALLLPRLYLFHDGRCLRVEWQADQPGTLPHMPGEFVSSSRGDETLDAVAVENQLAEFIQDVLKRLDQVCDERVERLRSLWHAIRSADSEERRYCQSAGIMGLDPYSSDDIPDELSSFIEQSLPERNTAMLQDFLEQARRDTIIDQWSWLMEASAQFHLLDENARNTASWDSWSDSPFEVGYASAKNARRNAGLGVTEPIPSLVQTAETLLDCRYRMVDYNHVPGTGLRAVVGRNDAKEVVAVGPLPQREDNRRFQGARALFQAYAHGVAETRLVTDAYSWTQKASRAFAAELLAPREALLSRLRNDVADWQTVEQLSEDYDVSTRVIELQLENAGIDISVE